MNKTVRTVGVGLLLLINLLLVVFLVFGRSGGRETVQDFVVAPTPTVFFIADPTPTAMPMQKRLGTSFGAVSLDMSEGDVVKSLGQPLERTFAPGNGSPEWRYTYVTLYGFKVWQIMATDGFPGATAEGFKLGDSRQTFKQLYAGFGVSDAFEERQIRIADKSGVWLQVNFDTQGKATSLLLGRELARSTQR
jgi:hypothetical protein